MFVLRNCVCPLQKVRLRFPSDLFYALAIIFQAKESSGVNAAVKFTVPLLYLYFTLSFSFAPLPLHLVRIVAAIVVGFSIFFFCLLTAFTFQIFLCTQQLLHIFSCATTPTTLPFTSCLVFIFLVTSCATTTGHYLLSVSAAHLFAYLSKQSTKR